MKIKDIFSGTTSKHLLKTCVVYAFISFFILFTSIIIARLYGQESLGIYSYFFGLVSLAFLFTSFGISDALTQILARDKRYLKSTLKYFFIFIILPTLIFIILFIWITDFLNLNPKLTGFKLAFISYIIFYTFFYLTYSILRGYKQFVIGSFYSLCQRILFIIFIFILFLISTSFIWVLIFMSISLIIATLISLPRIFKETTKEQIEIDKKTFFKTSISLFLTQVSFYALRYVDILTITYIFNFSDLGLYSAYSSVTNVIRLIAYVFPVVILPMAVTNKFKIRASFKKILLLAIPFSILIFIIAEIFVPILYGPAYKAVSLPLYLVISSFLLLIYSYFNSIFVGENKFSKFYITILIIDFFLSLIVNFILNFYLVTKLGLIGAPIATSIVVILKIFLNLYAINKLRSKN